jgi:hypothetical protein
MSAFGSKADIAGHSPNGTLCNVAGRHSALMLAARITLPHFSV